MCNIEVFIKYHEALNSYKLISKESLERTKTKIYLNDGSKTGAGYGLVLGEIVGRSYITYTKNVAGYFATTAGKKHEYYVSEPRYL